MAGRKITEEPVKDKGLNYSKWDNLEDSDDEREKAAAKAKAAPSKKEEKAHCYNCQGNIDVRVLRCGVCKVATYCSQKCQKEDWSYHKRACKKPEPKKTAEPKRQPKDPDAKSSAPRPKAKEDVVKDDVDDEKIEGWYRHREWKPQEPKAEFKPQKVDAGATGYAAPSVPTAAPSAGSAWNKAGTWEEKDMTEWAKRSLKEKVQQAEKVDTGTGELAVTEVNVTEVENASIGVIRGSVRYLFDLAFEVKFALKRMGSSGAETIEGTVTVKDFTNDAFGGESDPVISVSVKDRSMKVAIEEAVGGKDWPPKEGTLMSKVADALSFGLSNKNKKDMAVFL
eukprot:gnl/MRDRNA2_/MRDRNA2_130183_c0_seq1.p1 gnl/MRDRNA2_/MRDRNA2_130183_c0~~gnl/MRDRNA2_/MRDRNA2_130183_c0_seq1.p1  ORF type:complete len:350 (-),score=98.97 gnl/MRDRNA2_/MRDRNA2_130183_c0_seq1:74-1087(-)